MNAMDEKKELRSALLAQRLAIPTEEKQSLDRALVELAVTLPAFREAHLVLLYAPTKGEPDLRPLARRALDQGKKVAFPRCQPADRSLIFYTVSTTEELSQGCYGIPEPPIREPRPVFSKQTLCILPALSFDEEGYRLGYGGGYYDRFLANFPGVTVGLVYGQLIRQRLPRGPFDIPAHQIITERGILFSNEAATKHHE